MKIIILFSLSLFLWSCGKKTNEFSLDGNLNPIQTIDSIKSETSITGFKFDFIFKIGDNYFHKKSEIDSKKLLARLAFLDINKNERQIEDLRKFMLLNDIYIPTELEQVSSKLEILDATEKLSAVNFEIYSYLDPLKKINFSPERTKYKDVLFQKNFDRTSLDDLLPVENSPVLRKEPLLFFEIKNFQRNSQYIDTNDFLGDDNFIFVIFENNFYSFRFQNQDLSIKDLLKKIDPRSEFDQYGVLRKFYNLHEENNYTWKLYNTRIVDGYDKLQKKDALILEYAQKDEKIIPFSKKREQKNITIANNTYQIERQFSHTLMSSMFFIESMYYQPELFIFLSVDRDRSDMPRFKSTCKYKRRTLGNYQIFQTNELQQFFQETVIGNTVLTKETNQLLIQNPSIKNSSFEEFTPNNNCGASKDSKIVPYIYKFIGKMEITERLVF